MKNSTKTFLITCVVVLALVALFFVLHTKSTPTWQEQYDLGVRYLSDGNYQEAIIAFTAAIEIDAMRPEAYLKAAEAYEAVGDSEAARAILEKGYAATGDESLRPQEETPAPEPPEETVQEWILDDFISPQELTIGNAPFYTIDIYTAAESYPDGSFWSQSINPNEELLYSAGGLTFQQEPNKDVLGIVTYSPNPNHHPEFRGLTMGTRTEEALKILGFTEYAIQEILNFAENGIEYSESDMDSKINIVVEKTHIEIYNSEGALSVYISVRPTNAGEKYVDMYLFFTDSVLNLLTLQSY